MNYRIILPALLLMTNFSVAVASPAGGGKGYEDGLFWSADLNRNEQLDQDEAKAVHNLAQGDIFSRYDENGDGLINRTEFMEYMQQSPWIKKFTAPENK